MFAIRPLSCLLLLSLGGCGFVVSQAPIYDRNKDVIFDPRLLGVWTYHDENGVGTLRIDRVAQSRYRMENPSKQPAATEPADPMPDMELVQLGKYRYLFFDMHGTEFGTMLFPCYRVEFIGPDLRMSILNPVEFGQVLKSHPGMLKYEEEPVPAWDRVDLSATQSATTRRAPATAPSMPSNIILKDDPAKIRRLFVEHQDDPEWFAEVVVLHRVRAGEAIRR